MNDRWLREIQELEYIECLRTDIEREILDCEVNDENMEIKRFTIESKLIEDAEQLDYDIERCNLSPKSLRLKRIEFYEKKSVTCDQVVDTNPLCYEQGVKKTFIMTKQCTSITKKGKRCLKKSVSGMNVCCVHKK